MGYDLESISEKRTKVKKREDSSREGSDGQWGNSQSVLSCQQKYGSTSQGYARYFRDRYPLMEEDNAQYRRDQEPQHHNGK